MNQAVAGAYRRAAGRRAAARPGANACGHRRRLYGSMSSLLVEAWFWMTLTKSKANVPRPWTGAAHALAVPAPSVPFSPPSAWLCVRMLSLSAAGTAETTRPPPSLRRRRRRRPWARHHLPGGVVLQIAVGHHQGGRIGSRSVESRGGRGSLGLAHLLPALRLPAGASPPDSCPASTSRSSNRTCRLPASGSSGPSSLRIRPGRTASGTQVVCSASR